MSVDSEICLPIAPGIYNSDSMLNFEQHTICQLVIFLRLLIDVGTPLSLRVTALEIADSSTVQVNPTTLESLTVICTTCLLRQVRGPAPKEGKRKNMSVLETVCNLLAWW